MAEKVSMEFVQEGKNATEYSFSAHVTIIREPKPS